jgi:hypothetical protein
MKPSDFGDALRNAADVTGPNVAVHLRALAELCASSPLATVAATVTRLSKVGLSPAEEGSTVAEALEAVAPLQKFLSQYGNGSLAKDFAVLIGFLQRFPKAGVRPLVDEAIRRLSEPQGKPKPPLNEDVVQRHLRHLEQGLGNELAFTAAYKELEQDSEVGKLEIAELAKRFTETNAKSRSAALKKIWARHHTKMSFKAKSDSRDGRSAA